MVIKKWESILSFGHQKVGLSLLYKVGQLMGMDHMQTLPACA